MKLVLVLLVPLMLFSAWQFVRREENENRLALVASAVALRDVDVSCPGFWTRMVEITPNAGWVDFDAHGRPSDHTSLSASTCKNLERVWRGKQRSFACLLSGGCDDGDAPRRARDRHARPRVLAPARSAQRGPDAVLRRADDRGRGPELGVSPVDARVIALRVAVDDAAASPGEYHSPRCRPGAELDLHPKTPAWPTG